MKKNIVPRKKAEVVVQKDKYPYLFRLIHEFMQKRRPFFLNYPFKLAEMGLIIVFCLMCVLHGYYMVETATQYEILEEDTTRVYYWYDGTPIKAYYNQQTNLTPITQEDFNALYKPYNRYLIFGVIIWVLYMGLKETPLKLLKSIILLVRRRK